MGGRVLPRLIPLLESSDVSGVDAVGSVVGRRHVATGEACVSLTEVRPIATSTAAAALGLLELPSMLFLLLGLSGLRSHFFDRGRTFDRTGLALPSGFSEVDDILQLLSAI